MTFSIAARCLRSGAIGVASASGSLAVGNRCSWIQARAGCVITQNFTDIRLGPLGISLLAGGDPSEKVVEELVRQSEFPAVRQLAVIDNAGDTACYDGPDIATVHASWQGHSCVASGNTLATPIVPRAMVDSFGSRPDEPFIERLLGALDAGLAAGGEIRSLRSAALLVADEYEWPTVDLRVDRDGAPCAALRLLWSHYARRLDYMHKQVLHPYDIG